jgi:hypothetical protein
MVHVRSSLRTRTLKDRVGACRAASIDLAHLGPIVLGTSGTKQETRVMDDLDTTCVISRSDCSVSASS